MNKISIKQISKSFGEKKILKDVSFDVDTGNIVSLLGGSGAGKSTLLRILSNLEKPDSGKIELYQHQVGIVFQQFHLWRHLTVLENLIIAPIHVIKVSRKQAILEAQNLLSQLNILDKCEHFPSQLSGGEQQRVSIARALMMKPSLILFDEPTSALDPIRTQSVVEIIQDLAAKGMVILVATHDLGFAKSVANNALFLEEGIILENAIIQNQEIKTKNEKFLNFLNNTAKTLEV